MEYSRLVQLMELEMTVQAKYFYICLHIMGRGANISTSTRKLAKIVGVSLYSIVAAKRELIAAGLIEIEKGRPGKDGKPDTIRLVR